MYFTVELDLRIVVNTLKRERNGQFHKLREEIGVCILMNLVKIGLLDILKFSLC